MNISVASYSSIGGRDKNEDTILINNMGSSCIAVVCDGVGGHEYGEISSKIASSCIMQMCEENFMSPLVFRCAVKEANKQVLVSTRGKTTVAALWISGEDALATNIGDSRTYQFRGERIVFQSTDHSVVYYSYLNGEISYQDIRTSKFRNRITRALGASEDIKVEIKPLCIAKGDAFLICSDGFWEYIEENDMISTLNESRDSQEWLDKMKNIADKASSENRDNNSAIVIICN